MDATGFRAGQKRSIATFPSSSSLGGMHFQNMRATIAVPRATISSQGRGYPSSSLLLPVGFGGATGSNCHPESSPPVGGVTSEFGAPARTQATTRQAICPVPSPAPSPGVPFSRLSPAGMRGISRQESVPAPNPSPMHSPVLVARSLSHCAPAGSTPFGRSRSIEKQNAVDAILSKAVANGVGTAATAAMGAASSLASLAMAPGLYETYTFKGEPSLHDERVEARVVDIEQRFGRRFAELEQRFINQEASLVEVVAKLRQLGIDIDRCSTSIAWESMGEIREHEAVSKKLGTPNARPKADDKSQQSKVEPPGSTRSLFGGMSDSSQSNTSLDIYGQIRGLQARVDVLQYEIKIDAGRIDSLETHININAVSDCDKGQCLAGEVIERQSSGIVGSSPKAHQMDTTSPSAHSKILPAFRKASFAHSKIHLGDL